MAYASGHITWDTAGTLKYEASVSPIVILDKGQGSLS